MLPRSGCFLSFFKKNKKKKNLKWEFSVGTIFVFQTSERCFDLPPWVDLFSGSWLGFVAFSVWIHFQAWGINHIGERRGLEATYKERALDRTGYKDRQPLLFHGLYAVEYCSKGWPATSGLLNNMAGLSGIGILLWNTS